MPETNEETIKKLKKSKKYRTIKKDLLEQLIRAGNDREYYIDMVEDYMGMWTTGQLLQQDIEERGVRVKYDNGGGQFGYKKNDSIELKNKTNAQMLKILSELKITPNTAAGDCDDEEL